MTPVEFYDALKDDIEQKENEIKAITRSLSYVIRRQTHLIMSVQPGVKRISEEKMKKLMPFSWEQEFAENQTKDEMRGKMKAIAAAFKTKK